MSLRNAVVVVLIVFSFGFIGRAQTSQSSNSEAARKIVRKVDPRYPDLARKLNLGGTVKVVAVVASDGNVKKVEPLGGSPLLVQAAQSAISQWKFSPGEESRETVELHFTP
jgi:TonB family protein